MNESESPNSVAAFQVTLDAVMKAVHDCQHSTRGIIRKGSTYPEISWFISHVDFFIHFLEKSELTEKDEYVDLVSERNLARRFASGREQVAPKESDPQLAPEDPLLESSNLGPAIDEEDSDVDVALVVSTVCPEKTAVS